MKFKVGDYAYLRDHPDVIGKIFGVNHDHYESNLFKAFDGVYHIWYADFFLEPYFPTELELELLDERP